MKTNLENIKSFIGNGYMRQALERQNGMKLKPNEIDWIVQKLLGCLSEKKKL